VIYSWNLPMETERNGIRVHDVTRDEREEEEETETGRLEWKAKLV